MKGHAIFSETSTSAILVLVCSLLELCGHVSYGFGVIRLKIDKSARNLFDIFRNSDIVHQFLIPELNSFLRCTIDLCNSTHGLNISEIFKFLLPYHCQSFFSKLRHLRLNISFYIFVDINGHAVMKIDRNFSQLFLKHSIVKIRLLIIPQRQFLMIQMFKMFEIFLW